MNVNDIDEAKEVKNKLEFIFNKQKELMEKYHDIEIKNGIGYYLVKDIPFDINNNKWQYLIKDFAWRVTEEMAECLECDLNNNLIHAQEESSDALHFLIELMINVGIDHEYFEKIKDASDAWSWYFRSLTGSSDGALNMIIDLGLAMNCLKQKPWKQTHFETDIDKFRYHLMRAFEWWVVFVSTELSMTSNEAFQMYFKKSEVNKFRQRSNY